MSANNRMIRTRVPSETFDYFKHRSAEQGTSLAEFIRDILTGLMLEMQGKSVSEAPDTPAPEPEPLPPGKVGRPTVEQWDRLNRWLAATGRSPEPGTITTKSGLLAWAVGQGFQP